MVWVSQKSKVKSVEELGALQIPQTHAEFIIIMYNYVNYSARIKKTEEIVYDNCDILMNKSLL